MNKPKTIDECMVALTEVLSPEDRVEFFRMPENNLIKLHHGLGRWIRNNWELWGSSAEDGSLLKHMTDLGFRHPDDMSQAIIVEFWCRMNNKPSLLQEDIAKSAKYWEESKHGS